MKNDNRQPSEVTGLPDQLGGWLCRHRESSGLWGGFSALQPRATQKETDPSFERQPGGDEDTMTSLTPPPQTYRPGVQPQLGGPSEEGRRCHPSILASPALELTSSAGEPPGAPTVAAHTLSRRLSLLSLGRRGGVATSSHGEGRAPLPQAPKQNQFPPPQARRVYKVAAAPPIPSLKLGRKWGRGGGGDKGAGCSAQLKFGPRLLPAAQPAQRPQPAYHAARSPGEGRGCPPAAGERRGQARRRFPDICL